MLRRSVMTWHSEAERMGWMRSPVTSCWAFVPRVELGPGGTPRLVEDHSEGTWTMERFLGLVLGEMERLHDDESGYGPRGRGHFAHVEIPEEVWAAYLRVKDGEWGRIAER